MSIFPDDLNACFFPRLFLRAFLDKEDAESTSEFKRFQRPSMDVKGKLDGSMAEEALHDTLVNIDDELAKDPRLESIKSVRRNESPTSELNAELILDPKYCVFPLVSFCLCVLRSDETGATYVPRGDFQQGGFPRVAVKRANLAQCRVGFV